MNKDEEQFIRSLRFWIGVGTTILILLIGVFQWEVGQIAQENNDLEDVVSDHLRQGAHQFQEAKTEEIINRLERIEDELNQLNYGERT